MLASKGSITEGLNDAQLQAVTHVEGPVQVLSCAGSNTRVCTRCGEEKLLDEFRFAKRSGNYKTPRSRCRQCERELDAAYRSRMREENTVIESNGGFDEASRKVCSVCKISKPLRDFARAPTKRLCRSTLCRVCARHRDRVTSKTEAARSRKRRQMKQNYSTQSRRRKRLKEEAEPGYAQKCFARDKVRDSILRGKLVRGAECVICGASGVDIEAHHPDYSLSVYVLWVCKPCHCLYHAKGRRKSDWE